MNSKKDNFTFTLPDNRMVQPICIKNKGEKGFNRLHQTESFRKSKKNYKFFSPNNISLFVSITKRELTIARSIFSDLIAKKTVTGNEVIFDGEELTQLFNYFEHIQTSIIFSYTAVESFSNAAIPNSFVVEEVNNKGVKEIWDKKSIERWYSTSDKLIGILPKTLSVENPTNSPFWDDFKKLENLRNELIHLKTTSEEYKLERSFFKKFFHKNVFKIVESGLKIIQFFGDNNKARFFVPIELGNKKVDIIEIDEFKKHFTIKKPK